jgi:hypothetical protein
MTGMSDTYITEASRSAATFIAANLRDEDRQEFQAVFAEREPGPILTAIVAASEPFAFTAFLRGQPAFMFGVLAAPITPHLGVAWGFGTDGAPKIIPMVGRFVRKAMIPQLLQNGLHRVEVRVIASAESSVGWLTARMGAKFETDLPDCGVNQEHFKQFAWTRSDNVHDAKN